MFKYLKTAIQKGKKFDSEAALKKYLQGLHGYLVSKKLTNKMTKAHHGRILQLHREGRLFKTLSA